MYSREADSLRRHPDVTASLRCGASSSSSIDQDIIGRRTAGSIRHLLKRSNRCPSLPALCILLHALASVPPSLCPYSICGLCRFDCLQGLSDWRASVLRAARFHLVDLDSIGETDATICTDKKHRVMSDPVPSGNALGRKDLRATYWMESQSHNNA